MAQPIESLDCSQWKAKKPLSSNKEPTTSNAYIEGGPFFFALHGVLPREAIINPDKLKPGETITPQMRAAAVANLCVMLTDGHIKGDQYQSPGDECPTGLIKISDTAYKAIRQWQAWGLEQIIKYQEAWGLQPKSREVLESQFVDQLSIKDESPAVSVKWFRDSIKVAIQDKEFPWRFKRGGTTFDITQGCRFGAVCEFRGIRLKSKEWGLQKIIVNRIFIMTCGGNVAPELAIGAPGEDDDLGIEFEDEINEEPMDVDPYAAAASAAPASEPDADVDTTTMIGA